MADLRSLPFPLRTFLRMYAWRRVDPVPWSPLPKPLSQANVALVTTAGIVAPGQPPFDQSLRGGDYSFRVIDSDADLTTLGESHRSESFDRSGLERDLNLVLPLHRLRELDDAGAIGSFNRRVLSFMGSITAPGRLIRDTAPRAAALLVEDRVDAALLIPVWPMCNQAVGLIAAELERQGIATVCIMLLREVAERVRPPRSLVVPYEHGFPLGAPNDAPLQREVIVHALSLLERPEIEPASPQHF